MIPGFSHIDGHDGGPEDEVEDALSPEIDLGHCSVIFFFPLQSADFSWFSFFFSVKKLLQSDLVNSTCILELARTELKSDFSNYELCDLGLVMYPLISQFLPV